MVLRHGGCHLFLLVSAGDNHVLSSFWLLIYLDRFSNPNSLHSLCSFSTFTFSATFEPLFLSIFVFLSLSGWDHGELSGANSDPFIQYFCAMSFILMSSVPRWSPGSSVRLLDLWPHPKNPTLLRSTKTVWRLQDYWLSSCSHMQSSSNTIVSRGGIPLSPSQQQTSASLGRWVGRKNWFWLKVLIIPDLFCPVSGSRSLCL